MKKRKKPGRKIMRKLRVINGWTKGAHKGLKREEEDKKRDKK